MSKTQEPGRTLHIRFITRQVSSAKVIRSSDKYGGKKTKNAKHVFEKYRFAK